MSKILTPTTSPLDWKALLADPEKALALGLFRDFGGTGMRGRQRTARRNRYHFLPPYWTLSEVYVL